jgi:hypothetical protein
MVIFTLTHAYSEQMELDVLKSRWNEVLDFVLAENRIAWLAFFDARLVSLVDSTLTLDFADSQKLGGGHDFAAVRNPAHIELLKRAIKEITDQSLEISSS